MCLISSEGSFCLQIFSYPVFNTINHSKSYLASQKFCIFQWAIIFACLFFQHPSFNFKLASRLLSLLVYYLSSLFFSPHSSYHLSFLYHHFYFLKIMISSLFLKSKLIYYHITSVQILLCLLIHMLHRFLGKKFCGGSALYHKTMR